MKKTFEYFLQDRFMELEPQVLDDDLPDAFEAWLEKLDIEELMKFADAFGEYKALEGDTLKEIPREQNS